MSRKYSFDSKCFDLAEYFLPAEATESVKNELAQSIQDAVEDFTMEPPRRPTIDELQKILDSDDDRPIQIMPNGEIRQGGEPTEKKPLTMRDNLGGEYALSQGDV